MGGHSKNHQLREPSGTDHKTRTDDEHIHEEDKQSLHVTRGKLAIPEQSENPALKALKATKSSRKAKR